MAPSRGYNAHEPDSEPEPTCTKIYYASRTHSQLTQVLHELQSLHFGRDLQHDVSKGNDACCESTTVTSTGRHLTHPSGNPRKRAISVLLDESNIPSPHSSNCPVSGDETEPDAHVQVRAVSLGARKQLCINNRLRARASGELDEACRSLLSGESYSSV